MPRLAAIGALTIALPTALASVALAHHIPIAAQNLYGTITGERVLTAASPGPIYNLIGDLTIAPGASLLIERGVTIHAYANSDFLASNDPGRSEILVHGNLTTASGAGPIRFIAFATRADPDLAGTWGGITARSGGTVELVDVEIRHPSTAVSVNQGSIARLVRVSVFDVLPPYAAIYFDNGSAGFVRNCLLYGRMSGAGLRLAGDVSTMAADTLDPQPTRIEGFMTGVSLDESAVARNLLIVGCTEGIRAYAGTVDYCTLVDNAFGVNALYFATDTVVVRNSVAVWRRGDQLPSACYSGACEYNACCYGAGIQLVETPLAVVHNNDVWGYNPGGTNFRVYPLGPSWLNSSFDPGFDVDFRLGSGSFYTDFSTSGREIGAYGPGPGFATMVRTASVASSSVENGVVRIVWSTPDSPGERAVVQRRTLESDWMSQAPVQVADDRAITYEDHGAEPGKTYEYALAVRNADGIAFEGHVAVEVPALTTFDVTVAPSPTHGPCSISLALKPGTSSQLDVLDVTGRTRDSRAVSVPATGRAVISVDLSSLGSPGMYWVRVRQGPTTSTARVLLVR